MVQYRFSLKLAEWNERYEYILYLSSEQENNPEILFTSKVREDIRKSFQKQTSCKVDDIALNHILKVWKQDIEMGFRESALTLNLVLLSDSLIDNLVEEGNQEIPPLLKPDLSGIYPQFGALPPLIFQ
jgi:hypothetical protein